MKKIVLVALTALFFSATGFAKGAGEASANYNFDINVSKLSNYLQLSSSQAGTVSDICDYFTTQMKEASYSSKKSQQEKVSNAVYGNLKLMKETLTNEQYKKYVKLLNVTLKNKGIEL